MRNWSIDEIQVLQQCMEEGTSYQQIHQDFCSILGEYRSYESVRKKAKALEAHMEFIERTPYLKAEPPISLCDKDHPVGLYKNADQWLLELTELGKSIPKQKKVQIPISQSSLVIVLSDLHFGKTTPSFSPQIAVKRLLSIPEKLKTHVSLTGVNEIVIVLAGDLVDGEDIYATQASHLALSAIEQVQLCVKTLWTLIKTLQAQTGLNIHLHSVPGNHGRTSKTANEKTNWDNIVYYALSLLVHQDLESKISFSPNYEESLMIQIKDKVGMVNHHGVKHTGTPAMLIKVAGWNYSHPFDFFLHGHWHSLSIGSWLNTIVFSNGCLTGPDDLSKKMAKENFARQGFFKVTPDLPLHCFGFFEWHS